MKDKSKNKKPETIVNEAEDKKQEIKSHTHKEEDYKDMYLRALADYQNLSRQNAQEKQEFIKYANEQMLHSFLPIYDNLKTSLKHIGDLKEDNPWLLGVRYVLKQFADTLKEQGVEEIESIGKKFDHNTMEAVSGSGDKVAKELRPGYMLNGKVIIPAKVELETDELTKD